MYSTKAAARAVSSRGALTGEGAAEFVHRGAHLLLGYLLVLLALGGGLEPLPGQAAPVEVHEHVAQGLQVVAPGLLHAAVCVHGGVPGCTREVLVVPVGDVGALGAVALGQAEVDDLNATARPRHTHIYKVAPLAEAHEEVVGFHVAVDEVFVVDVLDAGQLKEGKAQRTWPGSPSGRPAAAPSSG